MVDEFRTNFEKLIKKQQEYERKVNNFLMVMYPDISKDWEMRLIPKENAELYGASPIMTLIQNYPKYFKKKRRKLRVLKKKVVDMPEPNPDEYAILRKGLDPIKEKKKGGFKLSTYKGRPILMPGDPVKKKLSRWRRLINWFKKKLGIKVDEYDIVQDDIIKDTKKKIYLLDSDNLDMILRDCGKHPELNHPHQRGKPKENNFESIDRIAPPCTQPDIMATYAGYWPKHIPEDIKEEIEDEIPGIEYVEIIENEDGSWSYMAGIDRGKAPGWD